MIWSHVGFSIDCRNRLWSVSFHERKVATMITLTRIIERLNWALHTLKTLWHNTRWWVTMKNSVFELASNFYTAPYICEINLTMADEPLRIVSIMTWWMLTIWYSVRWYFSSFTMMEENLLLRTTMNQTQKEFTFRDRRCSGSKILINELFDKPSMRKIVGWTEGIALVSVELTLT